MITIRARWVFPVISPPLENGSVTIVGDRIAEVKRYDHSAAIDIGDVAVIPAPVNAHTHLEFSQLDAPLGHPGIGMAQWIRLVLEFRRERDQDHSFRRALAVQKGLAELVDSGTSAVGDIATHWDTSPYLGNHHLEKTVFYESLGLDPTTAEKRVADADAFVQRNRAAQPSLQLGISPHAPYSVSDPLLEGLAALARIHRLPLAMHVAESEAEVELLRDGTGPLAELLEELGLPHSATWGRGETFMPVLHRLDVAPHIVLIHGSVLHDEALDFIAARSSRYRVVYCPRTHGFFQQASYPLEKMLNRGIVVALGTDSRASNPDLRVWREAAAVATRYPGVSPAEILKMATLHGALALGVNERLGALAAGYAARLAFVPLGAVGLRDPLEHIFCADALPMRLTRSE